MKNTNDIKLPRDKRGRMLPSMTRPNMIKMLGLSDDSSMSYILKMAEKTMRYNPQMRYNFRVMCFLEENAPTGLIKRKLKQLISA